jgi:hypothetical protein
MRHTNLWNEVYKGKKPDTSWHSTLVAVVVIITLCAGILLFGLLAEILA